jgi:hypothetical protein
MPWWPVLVFGWGPVVVAAIAFSVAFRRNRPWLAFVGAVIATPFLLTVSGYPRLQGPMVGPLVLLANFASAAMLRKGNRRVAMILLGPFIVLASVLACLVIAQEPSTVYRGK